MDLTVLREGTSGRRVLAEVNVGGRCKVDEQIEALDGEVQDAILAMMDAWVVDGDRGVEGGYWGWLNKGGKPKIEEWTPHKHVRIHWYADGSDIILIWVTRKNQKKAEPKDIKRAVKFANGYVEDKKRNGPRYV